MSVHIFPIYLVAKSRAQVGFCKVYTHVEDPGRFLAPLSPIVACVASVSGVKRKSEVICIKKNWGGGADSDRKERYNLPAWLIKTSDYLTSVPVHRRNPRLARVQRCLLVHTERSPHEWESSSRFYFLALSRPRHDNASFSLDLQ